MTSEAISNALKTVKYPGYSRDIVSFGLVKDITIDGGDVKVLMQLTSASPQVAQQIRMEAEAALRGLSGVKTAQVEVRLPEGTPAGTAAAAAGPNPWAQQSKITGIKRVVAVASGKGGVGKSTVAVNLACALSHLNAKVGLLDCDIYGPSVPLMMGINERPMINEQEKIEPPSRFGIKLMSMGFLLDPDAAVIWRGPMIMKTIQQFVQEVAWGELDYLLVDLPPGTGDAQLSLCQTVPLDGGVIVTTPQEASLGVVRKGITMFEKVNVPILGIIENMSYFTAPGGQRLEIFGHGGGKAEAERKNIPFLGEIPIFTEIREGGDRGMPVTVSTPDAPSGQAFIQIAKTLRQKLG